jgi:hypothetical protein
VVIPYEVWKKIVVAQAIDPPLLPVEELEVVGAKIPAPLTCKTFPTSAAVKVAVADENVLLLAVNTPSETVCTSPFAPAVLMFTYGTVLVVSAS